MKTVFRKRGPLTASLFALFALAACANDEPLDDDTENGVESTDEAIVTVPHTVWGSAANLQNGGFEALAARVGMPPIRRYYDWKAVPKDAQGRATVRVLLNLERTLPQAEMKAVIDKLKPGSYVTVQHEPIGNIKAGEFTLAQYVGWMTNLVKATRDSNASRTDGAKILAGPVLEGWTVMTEPKWIKDIYNPTMLGLMNACGCGGAFFDRYNGKTPKQNLTPAQAFDPLADIAADLKLPWGIGETGIPIEYDRGTGTTGLGLTPGNYTDAELASWWSSAASRVDGYTGRTAAGNTRRRPLFMLYWWSDNRFVKPNEPGEWNNYRFTPTLETSYTTPASAWPKTTQVFRGLFAGAS
jgi:hypothetical protein